MSANLPKQWLEKAAEDLAVAHFLQPRNCFNPVTPLPSFLKDYHPAYVTYSF